MSWKESDRVSERREFVELASNEGANFAALCRRFGVSRKTGYKWLGRFREGGVEALADQSRRPLNSPRRTSLLFTTTFWTLPREYSSLQQSETDLCSLGSTIA